MVRDILNWPRECAGYPLINQTDSRLNHCHKINNSQHAWEENRASKPLHRCERVGRVILMVVSLFTVVIPLIALAICRQDYINNFYMYRRYCLRALPSSGNILPSTYSNFPLSSEVAGGQKDDDRVEKSQSVSPIEEEADPPSTQDSLELEDNTHTDPRETSANADGEGDRAEVSKSVSSTEEEADPTSTQNSLEAEDNTHTESREPSGDNGEKGNGAEISKSVSPTEEEVDPPSTRNPLQLGDDTHREKVLGGENGPMENPLIEEAEKKQNTEMNPKEMVEAVGGRFFERSERFAMVHDGSPMKFCMHKEELCLGISCTKGKLSTFKLIPVKPLNLETLKSIVAKPYTYLLQHGDIFEGLPSAQAVREMAQKAKSVFVGPIWAAEYFNIEYPNTLHLIYAKTEAPYKNQLNVCHNGNPSICIGPMSKVSVEKIEEALGKGST